MTAIEPILGTVYRVDATDPPDLGAATLDIANMMSTRCVGYQATEAARDAAYAPMIAAGKVGMMCYVVNRDCPCFYTATGWKWMPVARLVRHVFLAGYVIGANADGLYVNVIPAAPTVLPPGLRYVTVTLSVDFQGSTALPGTGDARLELAGGPGGNVAARIDSVGPDGQQTVSRCWPMYLTGTMNVGVNLLHNTGSGFIDTYNVDLAITDHGPV